MVNLNGEDPKAWRNRSGRSTPHSIQRKGGRTFVIPLFITSSGLNVTEWRDGVDITELSYKWGACLDLPWRRRTVDPTRYREVPDG